MLEKSNDVINEAQSKLEEANAMLVQIEEKISKQNDAVEKVVEKENAVADLKRKIKTHQTERKGHEARIEELEETIEEWSAEIDSSALKKAKKEYKENYEKLLQLTEDKAEKQELLQYFQMAVVMLKDDGVKANQIDETLPQINEKINKYLKKFDMFVQFELTNTFEEVIKARHRDTFSYNSFSEGQKRRIDHSILFAFREIAMLKGSISCNIVAFDEILEKNLDEEGYETLKELIGMIDDGVNVFVITPQTVIPEFFDRTLTITYPNEFTKITEERK
jgi:DNA repair exonuclease SbcCD ATPase subunit